MGATLAVLYGAPGRIVAEIARAADAPILWLTDGARSAWLGTRQLIAQTLELGGAAVLARHRLALSIIAPALVAQLTADEQIARAALRADRRSHHVHSMVRWQPLLAAVGALIAELVDATGVAIAVPELADLDPLTALALGEAWRARPYPLWIGHDPHLVRPAERAWGVPVSWPLEQVRAQLCDYQLAPGCRVVWLAADGPTAPPPALAHRPAPDALAALEAAREPTPAELAGGVAAMRWAFEAHAFPAAFRLGVLLDAHRERLEPADQVAHAELTAIAATCAHFVDIATPGFDDRLDAMYARAIELADDPIDAAALAVRRAFAAVERAGASPVELINAAAVRVARIPDALVARYHGAWLAIVRALHQLHTAPRDVAARAVEQACTAIARACDARDPAMLDELASARFVILSHAALELAPTEPALAAQWRARADRDRADRSVIHRFEVMHWVLLAQRDDDRVVIYERCLDGLRDAERSWNARNGYLYRALAADSAYRLGHLTAATAHVRALLAVSPFGHPGVALVGDIAPLVRRVLLRAGADAELAALAPTDPEVQALSAHAAARRGDTAAAEAALDEAIETAVADGDHAVLCSVSVAAAQVMIALGRDASPALDSAWQLAEDEPGVWAEAISPPDRLRLCLAEATQRGATIVLVERVLAALPIALADADTWWDVTAILELAISHPAATTSAAASAGLAAVRRLAGNRVAWRDLLGDPQLLAA